MSFTLESVRWLFKYFGFIVTVFVSGSTAGNRMARLSLDFLFPLSNHGDVVWNLDVSWSSGVDKSILTAGGATSAVRAIRV
jgi:hypothetical protein